MALHVVFGHGQVGRLLTARLAADGHHVRVVTRTRPAALPRGVEHRAADLTRHDDAIAAAAGASVVHHVAGAPYADWPTVLPRLAAAALAAATATAAPLVYLDNLYAFGAPTGPISEDSPANPVEDKGRLRLRLAEQLLDAARRGAVPGVAVVHASDFFGDGVTSAVARALVFDALAAGKKPRWPVTLDQPHAMSYTPDVARVLAALGTRPPTGAQRWMVPSDGAPTGGEFAGLVARAHGRPGVAVGVLSPAVLRLAGLVNADARALARLVHQYDRPWVVDGARARARLGVEPTPLRQAVAETVGPSAATSVR
jgi:nucleoside-diphosphate-sugar epimerase